MLSEAYQPLLFFVLLLFVFITDFGLDVKESVDWTLVLTLNEMNLC
jgi:hypothetical protein